MTSINKKLLLLMKNQYEKLTVPVTKDESIERGKGGEGGGGFTCQRNVLF